jgi:capsular polysaccharide biosynthesis protein
MSEEIDLKELLSYYRSKIVFIAIVLILVLGFGNAYTILTRTPMYKSDTSIVLVSENKENYNSSELQLNKNLVGTYTEIIKSRKVLEPVIKNLKLKTSYNTLKNRVTVTSVQNTEIIKVTVADSNAKEAKKIANEIAKVFSEEIQKIYNLNNVTVVDKAIKATSPYNVNYIKDNVIYLAIGLVLSCGIVFIKFYFDTTIKTSEEIENKLGLTVLGIVPKVEKERV